MTDTDVTLTNIADLLDFTEPLACPETRMLIDLIRVLLEAGQQ